MFDNEAKKMHKRASMHSYDKLKKMCKYTVSVSGSKNTVKPHHSL